MGEKFEPKGEDQLQKEVIESYDLDKEKDKDLIDKIVKDRKKDEDFKASEKRKTAKAREEAENQKKGKEFYKKGGHNVKDKKKDKPDDPEGKPSGDVATIASRLDKMELQQLDVSEDVQDEIVKYAKVNGLSYAEAKKSDYIKYKIQQEDDKAKAEDSSADGSQKGKSKKDFSKVDPSKDFDLQTEEGRKEFEGYKTWLKEQDKS